MQLKFMLDYQCNPLWSNDDESREKYGFEIDNLEEIGLSNDTIRLSKLVADLHLEILNPIYQPLPSFWSGKMHRYFQEMVRKLYRNIILEIGNDFEIKNKELELIENDFNEAQIDKSLEGFITDPVTYFRKRNISFGSDQELINEVADEYKKWKEREIILLKQTGTNTS
jgi:hypothetical protein